MKVSGEFSPLSFYELCVHIHVNNTNFERHNSLEYNIIGDELLLNFGAKFQR